VDGVVHRRPRQQWEPLSHPGPDFIAGIRSRVRRVHALNRFSGLGRMNRCEIGAKRDEEVLRGLVHLLRSRPRCQTLEGNILGKMSRRHGFPHDRGRSLCLFQRFDEACTDDPGPVWTGLGGQRSGSWKTKRLHRSLRTSRKRYLGVRRGASIVFRHVIRGA